MKNIFKLVPCFVLLITLVGCEAFVRKFTRKPKEENVQQPEMIVAPEEYEKPAMSKEEQYRLYFVYWKSWQDELIESLASSSNQKKYLSCADQAIENLTQLQKIFKPEKLARIGDYLLRSQKLRVAIAGDMYNQSTSAHRYEAEAIRRGVLRDLSYSKVKGDLQ
jgi:hypothetical protein